MTLSQSAFRILIVPVAFALLAGAQGCDAGGESKTTDDIAADSALAADLALANRDTLLVDSIGALAPSDGTTADDTALVDADLKPELMGSPNPRPAASVPAATAPATRAPPSQATTNPTTAATPPARPVATPARPAVPAAPRTGVQACNSPTAQDQQTCVRVTLASTDMRLNRIYRALITEMRRQEGLSNGAKDPPSVQRLRVSQRAWLVYRDTECRRRGRGKEGRLWARPRVRCLGEFSGRRANELADQFSRLTAN